MDYSVSEERAALLEENFFEFSIHDRKPGRDFFDAITNPVELHLIASNYNWDDGTEVLTWIVESPLCEKATATMVFWHSQPGFFTQFDNVEDADWGGDVYTLLRTILKNLGVGFYPSGLIAYDPQSDPKAEGVDETYPNAKWQIPDDLKQPITGQIAIDVY